MGLYSFTSAAGSRVEETSTEDEIITVEFLEFLSDWETPQGDWSGPDSFVDDSFDQFYELDDEVGEGYDDEE